MFNLEDIILNIFGSLVASIIFKIMDKFIDKNKDSRNYYLDFSNTRQKKRYTVLIILILQLHTLEKDLANIAKYW